MIRMRALRPEDEPLLPQFLALAAHEENVEIVLSDPNLARYVGGWGRAGDTAVVAQDEETREIVGMAWARFWTLDNRGFGWVDELTPEMAVAVEPEFRGQGVGARLIEALKCRVRAIALDVCWDARHQTWVSASQPVEIEQPEMQIAPLNVSVNVRADSRAVRLYERLGFERTAGSQRTNRTGGESFSMSASLHEGQWRMGEMDRSIHLNGGSAPDDFVSVKFQFALCFDLFTATEQKRFSHLLANLPGAEEGRHWTFEEESDENFFLYFGCFPVKFAIHWAYLSAQIDSQGLTVSGDLGWKQWCEWEDAFLAQARYFPHEMHVRSL